MIYEPKEDSYLLEKEVMKYSRGKRVLDMGSGSGIQARAALNAGAREATATDIDDESVRELKKKGFKAIQSDLFKNVKGKFGLIIFNPPYLPEDELEDKESGRVTSGGKKGDEIILRFLKDAGMFLEKGGIVLLVVSSLTPQTGINKILKEKGLGKKTIASEKLFFERLEVWKIEEKSLPL